MAAPLLAISMRSHSCHGDHPRIGITYRSLVTAVSGGCNRKGAFVPDPPKTQAEKVSEVSISCYPASVSTTKGENVDLV